MEDPDMEWEIQENSPSKKGEVSRVRWMLNKGFGLGKKVVITGIAISSAPLFVPPLVVFSALGFAFSVPFGLVFASYACTDKVMSKLLPTPEPYPIIDYYTDEDEGEEAEFRDIVMEEEGKEPMEGRERGDEMRVHLDEDDDYWRKDYEAKTTTFADENVEGEGYEEDVGEENYMRDIQKEIEVREKNMEEQGYKEEANDNGEEIVRGSTGLLEKIRDEGNIGNEVNEERHSAHRMQGVGKGEVKIDDSVESEDVLMNKPIEDVKAMGEKERGAEETKMPFQEDDVKSDKPGENIERTAAQKREAAVTQEKLLEANSEEIDVPYKVNDVGKTENAVLGNGTTIQVLNGTANVQITGGKIEGTVKDQRPAVAKKKKGKKGRAAYNTSSAERNRENDLRAMADKSGFDLHDDRNAATHQTSYTAFQSLDAPDDSKEGSVEVDVDHMALPTSGRMPESYNVKNGAGKDEVPYSEVLLKEEKVWEQINALRAIVGYTAAPQTACVEEVKALYVFTGVEPPFQFKEPSDLADVNDKLRFLMSIVGVK